MVELELGVPVPLGPDDCLLIRRDGSVDCCPRFGQGCLAVVEVVEIVPLQQAEIAADGVRLDQLAFLDVHEIPARGRNVPPDLKHRRQTRTRRGEMDPASGVD